MIEIRGIELGAGRPKVCVPITGKNKLEILEQAEEISSLNVEAVEWRADFTELVSDYEEVKAILSDLRKQLPEKLLLFTFRSKKEGGEKDLEETEYFQLNEFVAETQLADLVDIEFFTNDSLRKSYIKKIQEKGCRIILSNHDFYKTPGKEELINRFTTMEKDGADILKIAVMPESPADVLTLLEATYETTKQVKCPIVTMSMSKLGMITRMSGEIFGSALTFGMAGNASAPGQIPVEKLNMCLDLMSK